MLPSDPTILNRAGITSPSLASCVHVTPLRASRALALRCGLPQQCIVCSLMHRLFVESLLRARLKACFSFCDAGFECVDLRRRHGMSD